MRRGARSKMEIWGDLYYGEGGAVTEMRGAGECLSPARRGAGLSSPLCMVDGGRDGGRQTGLSVWCLAVEPSLYCDGRLC